MRMGLRRFTRSHRISRQTLFVDLLWFVWRYKKLIKHSIYLICVVIPMVVLFFKFIKVSSTLQKTESLNKHYLPNIRVFGDANQSKIILIDISVTFSIIFYLSYIIIFIICDLFFMRFITKHIRIKFT